jgi:hypothetical protein
MCISDSLMRVDAELQYYVYGISLNLIENIQNNLFRQTLLTCTLHKMVTVFRNLVELDVQDMWHLWK